MITPPTSRQRTLLLAAVALAAAIAPVLLTRAQAQPATQPAATPAAARAGADAHADQVLHKMATFYKGLRSASLDMATTLKIEGGGHDTDMSAHQTLAFERPNKLALVTTSGSSGTVVSDGKTLSVSMPTMGNKYAQEDAPQTLADLIRNQFAAGAVGPAAMVLTLFGDDPYAGLMENVKSAKYVGQGTIDGAACDHLSLQQEPADIELWVTQGDKPLLKRVDMDLSQQFRKMAEQMPQMKDMKGQMRLELAAWKIDQPVPAARFAFAPPAGAQKSESLGAMFGVEESKLKGQPAAAFSLDLLGGGKADLKQLAGKKIVIVDFWATWCPPCVMSLPLVAEVAKKYADKGVVFYAINEEEEVGTIKKFLTDKGLDIPVALDPEGETAKLYGVTGIPQTVIIGKDGLIKEVHIGYDPGVKQALSRELDKALAAKAPAPKPAN